MRKTTIKGNGTEEGVAWKMTSNITTKQGDTGMTMALDGRVLDKCHTMMEAVGALDMLRGHTALLRLQLMEQASDALPEIEFLFYLLHCYFLLGATLSDPLGQRPGEIGQGHLERLEAMQARLEDNLRLPGAFIASATNTLAAQADITASVARAFERRLVAFRLDTPGFEHPFILAFANRLSDYFFILARHLEHGNHQVVNYDVLA